MQKTLIAILLLICVSCASMSQSQWESLAEVAAVAIGMTVEILMERAGEPDARYSVRNSGEYREILIYDGFTFYAENGSVYDVLQNDIEVE